MKHIGQLMGPTLPTLPDGTGVTLCKKTVPSGEWMAGAAYQGMMILGMKAEEWCPECQRVWLKERNQTPSRQ